MANGRFRLFLSTCLSSGLFTTHYTQAYLPKQLIQPSHTPNDATLVDVSELDDLKQWFVVWVFRVLPLALFLALPASPTRHNCCRGPRSTFVPLHILLIIT